MAWNIRIDDPSGETRVFPVHGAVSVGRDESCEVPLRDPLVARKALLLWPASERELWVRVQEGTSHFRLGDMLAREAQIPAELPLVLGETRITLQSEKTTETALEQPRGIRPWLTCSESGKKLLWNAKKSAATPLSIYIAGETGTGKEILAHLLHAWSERASGPFVPLHCGALALSLAESELFGHVKGAFTGAHQHRPGALMQAHSGTLFLDEVGDLPMDIQVKLLRFLEDGEIRPVGADRPSRADVRLICATHHPLLRLVEEGKFRRDLYYRLASITLEIPTLRSRPEDIELLSRKFASDLKKTITPRALLRLQSHRWPGNVRELRHCIERACGLAGSFMEILGEEAFEFLQDSPDSGAGLEPVAGALTLVEMEKLMLLKALRLSHGNRAQAAKILGIARSTLFEMLKRHKIPGPRTPQNLVH